MDNERTNLTAAELLDVAREAWQKYDLKEVVGEYADMGASVMMDLAMNATPVTDELATLRAQLAEAQAERDTLREAIRATFDQLQIIGNGDGMNGGTAEFAALLEAFKILRTAMRHKHTADAGSEGGDG